MTEKARLVEVMYVAQCHNIPYVAHTSSDAPQGRIKGQRFPQKKYSRQRPTMGMSKMLTESLIIPMVGRMVPGEYE